MDTHTFQSLPDVQSLEDVRALLSALPAPDAETREKARRRDAALTKPPGALGRLEEIAAFMSAWQGRHPPRLERVTVAVFAANHGVAARGVSAFPQDVTAQMVANFEAGGAAINQLCRAFGYELTVLPLHDLKPTGDISREEAMTEAQCVRAVRAGMTVVNERPDLLCIGEMGIANTTVASALLHALFGGHAEDWVGPGTGVDAAGVRHKAAVVATAVQRHAVAKDDPLELLRRLGGFEFAAMAGAIIAARHMRAPVMLDGFMTAAAAAVLHAAAPESIAHCLAGHVSAEPAHARALAHMNLRPLLDLDMRLGEATGAALAAQVVRAAVETHNGMATFAEAGVSGKDG